MYLDRLRDETTREKKNAILQCELSHRRKLRELYHITALVGAQTPPDFDFHHLTVDADPDHDELRFLDANDLAKGQLFRDSSLDYPIRVHFTPPRPSDSHEQPELTLPTTTVPSASHDAVKPNDTSVTPKVTTPPILNNARPPIDEPVRAPSTSSALDEKLKQVKSVSARAESDRVAPDRNLEIIATNGSESTPTNHPSLDDKPSQPPFVATVKVDISKDVKDSKEDDRAGNGTINLAAELASSPSSTVGPYSTTTPHPVQHSPDTSPEQDTFSVDGSLARQRHTELPPLLITKPQDVPLQVVPETASDKQHSSGPLTPADQQQLHEEQARFLTSERLSRALQQKRTDGQVSETPVQGTEPARPASPPQSKPNLISPVQKQPTPPPDVEMSDVFGSTILKVSPSKDGSTHHTDVDHLAPPGFAPRDEDKYRSSPPVGALTPESGAVAPLKKINLQVAQAGIRKRHNERKKQCTVVFPKKDADLYYNPSQYNSEEYAALRGASLDDGKDYLLGLFTHQAHLSPRSTSLEQLLHQANKSVSTTNYSAWLRDYQDYKILKRVYQLQNANRWSLRQLEKTAEPTRPITHDDFMLCEMRWMRIDFRQERKLKLSIAKTLAARCADYVTGSAEQKARLRIKSTIPPPRAHDLSNGPELDGKAFATLADLQVVDPTKYYADSLIDDDELSRSASALFSLGFDDVFLEIDENPANEQLLNELPMYDYSSKLDQLENGPIEPAILPVSKFVAGKLVTKSTGPPRKRSRYEYEQEDELSDQSSIRPTPEHSRPSTPGRRLHRDDLPPEKTDVALFNYENKHVRDRLHASHVFRPPSEFPMPSVSFLASRSSSQWHWDEDQKLRQLVKEYQFNWSLIASELTTPSMFTSGAERRTPWECFERWVQLEGLPTEMGKTQYFRTYQSRLEEAQRSVTASYQLAQQQMAQQQGQPQPNNPPRRRTSQPFRVERRKNNRYLTLIDAMRKLARKRESAAHKQAEAVKAAQLRKAHEPAPPKTTVHTPAEFSRLKYEREQQQERREAMRQQQAQMMLAQQRQNARTQGANGQNVNGAPQQRGGGMSNNSATMQNGAGSTTTSQMSNTATPGTMQARSNAGQAMMQANMGNGNMNGMGMNMNGMPQAQMQMPSQQRMNGNSQDNNLRLAMQQRQFAGMTQQQQYQLQQQLKNTNSLANAHLAGTNMALQGQQNMMAAAMAAKQVNGTGNGAVNGVPRTSGSPPMNMASPQNNQGRPLSSGHVPAITQLQLQLQQAHPEWNREQITTAAQEQLNMRIRSQQVRQNAMNAAGGNVYPGNGNVLPNGSPNNTQHFNQQAYMQNMLRTTAQQQAQAQAQAQSQAGSPNMTTARPVSRSATPQNPQQLQQQQQVQQSPGMQQAQMTRN